MPPAFGTVCNVPTSADPFFVTKIAGHETGHANSSSTLVHNTRSFTSMSTIWLYAMLLDTFTTYNLFYFIVRFRKNCVRKSQTSVCFST